MTTRAPFLLTAAVLAVAAIAVLGGRATAAVSPDGCANSGVSATRLTDEAYADAIACLVNARRAAAGRRALNGSVQLQRAATRHSAAMVSLGFFSHTGPGRSTIVSRLRATRYIRGRLT